MGWKSWEKCWALLNVESLTWFCKNIYKTMPSSPEPLTKKKIPTASDLKFTKILCFFHQNERTSKKLKWKRNSKLHRINFLLVATDAYLLMFNHAFQTKAHASDQVRRFVDVVLFFPNWQAEAPFQVQTTDVTAIVGEALYAECAGKHLSPRLTNMAELWQQLIT